MNQKEVKARIIANIGEMPNVNAIARHVGCSRGTARKIMNGYPCFTMGRDKRYTADDVARAIMGRNA